MRLKEWCGMCGSYHEGGESHLAMVEMPPILPPRTEMKCRLCGCFSSAQVCWDCTATQMGANPIPLNGAQEDAVKRWAADNRLWTTQETVEFNLRTFARDILSKAMTRT